MTAYEVNFDGLVGPTHNYAGISLGKVASMSHRGAVSRPRDAALQGLAKARTLAAMGVRQAILPPHERPSLETLRACGFTGPDSLVLERDAPDLLRACSSASNMWVANAATVTPADAAADRRVHFTPANLVSKFHRAIEPPQTTRTLRAIFHDESRFSVHAPVPGGQNNGDEGAANHTRFTPVPGRRGLHFFVYGHSALGSPHVTRHPTRFPSRQALEASEAVARAHLLAPGAAVFAQQHPEAIDAGVFHNDVIAFGNDDVLLYHERAFLRGDAVIDDLRRAYAKLHRGRELIAIKVPAARVPLADAVRSYLFNSQLVTIRPGRMALIAPADCASVPSVDAYLRDLLSSGRTPLVERHDFDLKESMRNGGGPACLRLRVVLTRAELAALPPTSSSTTPPTPNSSPGSNATTAKPSPPPTSPPPPSSKNLAAPSTPLPPSSASAGSTPSSSRNVPPFL